MWSGRVLNSGMHPSGRISSLIPDRRAAIIFSFDYEKNIKYIGINPHPESWITDSIDKIDEIIDNEIKELLGIKKNELISSSSSSKSKSSSSSQSIIYDDEVRIQKPDELNESMLKSKGCSYKKQEPLEPELEALLDEM